MPLRPKMQPQEILEIFLRRKWIVIFSFLFILFGASVYCVVTPEMYRSTTTILVVPQKVPENYVRSTVSISIAGRLASMQQQVLSRTRVFAVMDELGLFKEERRNKSVEAVVNMMRKRISIEVRQNDSFTLSYVHENPQMAMLTASRLASFFIEENLKSRAHQAIGTSNFLDSQLQETKKRLEEQEARVRQYKTQFMGELPQQLQANLQILSRLQDQQKANAEAIRSAQDRKAFLDEQIHSSEAQLSALESQAIAAGKGDNSAAFSLESPVIPEDPAAYLVADLNAKRAQLADLSNRYTDRYPEIRRLKSDIAAIESRIDEVRKMGPSSPPASKAAPAGSGRSGQNVWQGIAAREKEEIRRLRTQLAEVEKRIKTLNAEEEQIRKNVASLEGRVEKAPKREQEMISITRDYDNLRRSYDDLLSKKLQAEVSRNLEKQQSGEQFQILDPAHLPESPYVPNRPKIFGFAVIAAFLVGFGGAIGLEFFDTTIRGTKEFKYFSNLPVLAAIPSIQDTAYMRSLAIRRAAVYGGLITFTSAVTVFLIVYGGKVRIILERAR